MALATGYASAGNNTQYIRQVICHTPTIGYLLSSFDSGFGNMGRFSPPRIF